MGEVINRRTDEEKASFVDSEDKLALEKYSSHDSEDPSQYFYLSEAQNLELGRCSLVF